MFKLEKIVNSTNSAPEQTIVAYLDEDLAIVGISEGTACDLCDGYVYPASGETTAHYMTAASVKLTKIPVSEEDASIKCPVYILSQDMIFKAPVEGNAFTMTPGVAYEFNDDGTGLTTNYAPSKRGAVVVEVVSATEVLCVINQNLPSGRQE